MTTQTPVIKNGAGGAIIYTALISQAAPATFQTNPTLAAGDVRIAIDGGAFANLATLPVVTPAAGKAVKVTLSQAETNGDNLVILFSDVAGAEWCDQTIHIETAARHFDDLAFPATSGRGIVVDAAGLVDANAVKLGPTGAGTAQTARDVGATLGAAGAGLTAIGDVRLANLDATVSSRLATAGYTVPPTANANADALLDRVDGVETGQTVRQWLRLAAAVLFGKAAGMATTTATFRDRADTKNRITATVDASGNRTAVTTDPT